MVNSVKSAAHLQFKLNTPQLWVARFYFSLGKAAVPQTFSLHVQRPPQSSQLNTKQPEHLQPRHVQSSNVLIDSAQKLTESQSKLQHLAEELMARARGYFSCTDAERRGNTAPRCPLAPTTHCQSKLLSSQGTCCRARRKQEIQAGWQEGNTRLQDQGYNDLTDNIGITPRTLRNCLTKALIIALN